MNIQTRIFENEVVRVHYRAGDGGEGGSCGGDCGPGGSACDGDCDG